MSVDFSTVRTRLKARLDTITGLSNFKEEPDTLPTPPFSVLGKGEIDFNTDLGGGRDFSFRLFIGVGYPDAAAAWTALDAYLASSGTKSVKAALEGASAGAVNAGDYTDVVRIENIGAVEYRGRVFVGAEFIVKVASGG